MRRRLVMAFAAAAALVAVAVVLVARSERGREAVRQRIVGTLVAATGGPVAIGRIETLGVRSLVFADVSIGDRSFRASARRIEITLRPWALVRGTVRLSRVVVEEPRVRIARTASDAATSVAPGVDVVIDRLVVREGRVVFPRPGTAEGHVGLDGIEAAGAVEVARGGWRVAVESLRGRGRAIALGEIRAAGEIGRAGSGPLALEAIRIATGRSRVTGEARIGDDIVVAAHATPLAWRDVRALAPGAHLASDLEMTLAARGPAAALDVAADVRPAAGGIVRARGVADTTASRIAGTLRVEAEATDPGAVWLGLPRMTAGGRLRGRLVARRWTARADATARDLERSIPGLSGAARVGIRARGSDTVESVRGRAQARLHRAALASVPLLRAGARGTLDGGRASVVGSIAIAEGSATASGSWDLATGKAELHATGAGNLAGLAGVTGRPTAGRAAVEARLAGPVDALDGTVTADATGIRVGGVAASNVRLEAAVSGAGGTGASARVRLESPGVALGERRLGPLALAGRVERAAQGATITLDTLALSVPSGRVWRLARPARGRIDGGVAIDAFEIAAGAGRIAASGVVRANGPSDARLVADGVALADLCPVLTTFPCDGVLDARVQLRGEPRARSLDLAVAARDVRVDERPVGRIDLRAEGPVTGLRLDGRLAHPSAGALEMAGTLAVGGGDPQSVDVRLRTHDFDPAPLGALAPAHVRRLGGALEADLHIRGAFAAPRVSGFAELRRGVVALAASGVVFEPVRIRMDADGAAADVVLVRAVTPEGTMSGEGRIDFAAGGALDLRLRPGGARVVHRPGMQASAAGEVHVGGTIGAPVISGRLELVDVVIRPAQLPLAQPAVVDDPTIEVVGGRAAAPRAAKDAMPAPPPDRLGVALDVRVAPGARVVRSDAALELDGDVRVTKVAGAGPRVGGTLWLRKGWFVFEGRRFWLTGGAVSFLETDPPSAWVDVWAEYRSGEYLVLVGLVGPIEKPDLQLVSDPPLGEADVLAVLLFGRPTGQLGAGEASGLQRQAIGLATDYAAPGLRRSVMDVLRLDTLDVEVPTGGSEVPGEVRVGRYVGEDLFLSLAQEFGAGVAQVVGAEYVVGGGFSVRVSASSAGRGAVDLLWGRRY